MNALATPVTASVTPGPAVTIATPGRPVSARPSVGHVRRGLLVTRVDHAKAVRAAGRVDRVEMAAVEGENLAYALVLERPYQHLAAVYLCHWRISLCACEERLRSQASTVRVLPLHLIDPRLRIRLARASPFELSRKESLPRSDTARTNENSSLNDRSVQARRMHSLSYPRHERDGAKNGYLPRAKRRISQGRRCQSRKRSSLRQGGPSPGSGDA